MTSRECSPVSCGRPFGHQRCIGSFNILLCRKRDDPRGIGDEVVTIDEVNHDDGMMPFPWVLAGAGTMDLSNLPCIYTRGLRRHFLPLHRDAFVSRYVGEAYYGLHHCFICVRSSMFPSSSCDL